MREVVETEMTGKEVLTSHFLQTIKNSTGSFTESLKMELNEDGTNTVSELLTLPTLPTSSVLCHIVTQSQEDSSATHLLEPPLPAITFAEMNMIKFMVLSLVLMDTLKVGPQTLLVDSMVIVMTEMDEVVPTFFVQFLLLKFVDSTGEDALLDKISNPPWKIF